MDVPKKERDVNVKTIEEWLQHSIFYFLFIYSFIFWGDIINSKLYVVGIFYEY